MIRQHIHIREIDWSVECYYAVTYLNVDEVMHSLERAGCTGENFRTAYDNLTNGDLNTGLCFTGEGRSVFVVSLTSSGGELANSLVHELHHLASQIGREVGFDPMGEDVCYLAGDIAKKMYNVVGKYLCEGCRDYGRYRKIY